ncbi:MAG: hypothetical protein IJP96_10955 [Synergistaceae bacterium]|nr:hypothetical protein [Synergistaceae bacterium]
MTDLERKADKYRLDLTTTPERIKVDFFTSDAVFLEFGDKFLMSCYTWKNKTGYYAAIYQFTTDNYDCDGTIELVKISDEFFEDKGHAIEWALKQ